MSTYSERPPWSSYVLPVLALVIAVAALGVRFWPQHDSVTDPNVELRTVTPAGDLAADEKATSELFRKVSPSVVYITTLVIRRDAFNLNLYKIPQGTGSGFVWDKKGHIVTNFHVVQEAYQRKQNGEAEAIEVTLDDHAARGEKAWPAKIVGVAPDKDLAVLWIGASADRLHPIPLGTSHDLLVGQNAFAIGNPFGLDHSLTKGIISALGREIEAPSGTTIQGAIQTDAAINPGNSGGPLLDSSARLIGVNTAIFSPGRNQGDAGSVGIGFAIPVDEVNQVVTDLIRHGKVIRPGLGIRIASDQQLRRPGVLILDVVPDGPAAKAGLRPTRYSRSGQPQFGDIIVAIDDKPVANVSDLGKLLGKFKVGDKVKVAVERDQEMIDVQVTLGAV